MSTHTLAAIAAVFTVANTFFLLFLHLGVDLVLNGVREIIRELRTKS